MTPEEKRVYNQEYYAKNRATLLDKQRTGRTHDTVQAKREYNRERYKRKKATILAQMRAYYANNKARISSLRAAHYMNNKAAVVERAGRRERRLRHGSLWTTPAEQLEINGLYLFTSCFPGFEVDHIVPLNGETVSGLHVLSNLQVVTRAENRAKGNKFCPAAAQLVQLTRS